LIPISLSINNVEFSSRLWLTGKEQVLSIGSKFLKGRIIFGYNANSLFESIFLSSILKTTIDWNLEFDLMIFSRVF
jgi:hypothetical protein